MDKKEKIQEENIEQEEQTSSEAQNEQTTQETEVVEDKYENIAEEYKAEMEAKVKEAEDKYLRTHAEFENIKKRLEREKYSAIDYASEKFAKDLLAPIDALEMALQSANADISAEQQLEKLKEGIELTIKSFLSAFEKHNINIVETDTFDPEFHNAVMKVDSDNHTEGDIVQVMQKGYTFKDRLLRPAMVSIAN